MSKGKGRNTVYSWKIWTLFLNGDHSLQLNTSNGSGAPYRPTSDDYSVAIFSVTSKIFINNILQRNKANGNITTVSFFSANIADYKTIKNKRTVQWKKKINYITKDPSYSEPNCASIWFDLVISTAK